jgi:hypothetical protein
VYEPGDGESGDAEREALDALGGRGDDAPPPASRVQRSIAGAIAFVFIVAIVVFLNWFMATHMERSDGTSLGAARGGSGIGNETRNESRAA